MIIVPIKKKIALHAVAKKVQAFLLVLNISNMKINVDWYFTSLMCWILYSLMPFQKGWVSRAVCCSLVNHSSDHWIWIITVLMLSYVMHCVWNMAPVYMFLNKLPRALRIHDLVNWLISMPCWASLEWDKHICKAWGVKQSLVHPGEHSGLIGGGRDVELHSFYACSSRRYVKGWNNITAHSTAMEPPENTECEHDEGTVAHT